MPIYNVQLTRTLTYTYNASVESSDEPTATRIAINQATEGGFQLNNDEINSECYMQVPSSSYVPLTQLNNESTSTPQDSYTSISSLFGD